MKKQTWDEALRICLKESHLRGKDHYSTMLEVLHQYRTTVPIFRIDKDVYEAIFPFGEDMVKKPADDDNCKLIRAPYPTQIIEMSNESHSLNLVIVDGQSDKHDPRQRLEMYGYTLMDNKIIVPALSIFVDTSMRGGDIKDVCVGASTSRSVTVHGNTEEERKAFMAKFFQEQAGFVHLSVCSMIGFCLSIAAKGMLEGKTYQPVKRYVKNKLGRRQCIQESGYTKIKLSLKGKEHLEYIRERKDGDRSSARMHFRRGHFKQRATGLFWWSAHLLYKDAEHSITHDYEVTK